MAQKWTVEFTVADSWVADGFDLDQERAKGMIELAIPYAYGYETDATIIKSPPAYTIEGLQQGRLEPKD